jgi:hypothetical protein
MPLTYTRDDADLTIRIAGAQLLFELQSGGSIHRLSTGVTLLDSTSGLVSALGDWAPLIAAVKRTSTDVRLSRLVIRTEEPRTAAVDWEDVLGHLSSVTPTRSLTVMRATEVLSRSLSRRFDFPARVLEIGAPARLATVGAQLLHGTSKDYAFVIRSTSLRIAAETVASLRWPSVDILHVHARAAHDALNRSRQTAPGGLTWLLLEADLWKVRLLVLEALPSDAPALRQAAQRFIQRGGPAVFVLPSSFANMLVLYAALLHDRPLDWVQGKLLKSALFAGGGRTETVRFSRIGVELTSPAVRTAVRQWMKKHRATIRRETPVVPLKTHAVAKVLRDVGQDLGIKSKYGIQLPGGSLTDVQRMVRFSDIVSTKLLDLGYVYRPSHRNLRRIFGRQSMSTTTLATYVMKKSVPLQASVAGRSSVTLDTLVMERFANLDEVMKVSSFEEHESDGTLPLATTTTDLRKLIVRSVTKPEQPATPSPRHVNVGFYERGEFGAPREIPQPGARLTVGEVVHLGLRIGEPSTTLFSVGDMVFADEAIDWTKEKLGVWLEVGVTGIDVDVLGDPVQTVWFPAVGETTLATFAIRPRAETAIPGVARLRITVFYRNNVVQSFLVAAALTTVRGDVKRALAKALTVESKAVRDDAGYIARQEYSALDPNRVSTLPHRTLSIVANESAGQEVFSVKGTDFFSTTTNENVRTHVEALRAALTAASHGGVPEEYRFDDQNAGKESELLGLLWDVASRGFELWTLIMPKEADREEVRKLLGDGGVVTAAHMDLRDVVPWSLIYDREVKVQDKYSPNWADEHAPVYEVDRALCPVTLPNVDGTMRPVECGTDPKCVLHAQSLAARQAAGRTVLPTTAICPRRFWGFMHLIEVPVQQKSTAPAPTRPVQQVVQAEAPVHVVAAFNEHVKLAPDHRQRIEGVATTAKAALTASKRAPRDALIQTLQQVQPDLVYLYCHAWLNTLQKPKDAHANLDFGKRLDTDIAFAANFTGPEWAHAPVVFLNGCATVGFTPAAPSEFVTQFIQGRNASAVIGTEVTVWAELADEVGWKFCEGFLDGKKNAGATLLAIRRQLLHKYNPLGLVYTLYGNASVRLQRPHAGTT